MSRLAIGDREYNFELDSVSNEEGIAIENAMGMTFGKWAASLAEGSISSLTALVWLFQRRENPALRFNDVSFTIGEVRITGDDDDSEATAHTDIVPGELQATYDPKDPMPAPEVFTTEG
jgi:hypothetical protein